jgi:hypothetical protein
VDPRRSSEPGNRITAEFKKDLSKNSKTDEALELETYGQPADSERVDKEYTGCYIQPGPEEECYLSKYGTI